MRSLFLSNAPILGGTARILQSWLLLGRSDGMSGALVLREGSHLIDWAREREFETLVDPMPWMDRKRPWHSLWHAARVGRWARRLGPDFIHCNEHDMFPFALLLRKFIRRPMVCHVRYRISREFAEWAFQGRLPDALLWTSYQQKQDSADAVAGIVPEERQHVVRLGVDMSQFGKGRASRDATRAEWGVREDEILIATPSPIRVRKRIHEFVEMMATLAAKNPRVVGIIAGGTVPGEEAYRDQIVQQIAATGLGRRLQWVGYLEPVEPLYHASDVVVSTSEYETFGNSVCEAMACRRPVVGYRGGSVHEVVGDAGLIVETGDLAGLTAAVERIVQDESLRWGLGERARARVAECFNPTKSFEQLCEIYQTILSRNLAPCRN